MQYLYSNVNLKPWLDIIKIPHFFADDGVLLQNLKALLSVEGFHPIHIFLNSENLDNAKICYGVKWLENLI